MYPIVLVVEVINGSCSINNSCSSGTYSGKRSSTRLVIVVVSVRTSISSSCSSSGTYSGTGSSTRLVIVVVSVRTSSRSDEW